MTSERFVVFDRSPAMRAVMALARVAAASRTGVLVTGEPGTGREAVARAIHAFGGPAGAPFVAVDCAGKTAQSLTRALFGQLTPEARRDRRRLPHIGQDSLLQRASGGSLLLFNVAEAPLPLQGAVARAIAGRGAVDDARQVVELDIRPIGVMDAPRGKAVPLQRWHPELRAQLNRTRIDVPSLGERPEDIPLLAAHLLRTIPGAQVGAPRSLSRPALLLLSSLRWRGNGRELQAVLECVAATAGRPVIQLSDVLKHVRLEGGLASMHDGPRPLKEARAMFEREYIGAVLAAHDGRVEAAARALGIQRTNLYRKVRQLNVAHAGRRP